LEGVKWEGAGFCSLGFRRATWCIISYSLLSVEVKDSCVIDTAVVSANGGGGESMGTISNSKKDHWAVEVNNKMQ
jgi:hypothetical protein